MQKRITYALHPEGYVVSRVGSEMAWPVLDWNAMTPENSFTTLYLLERVSVHSVANEYHLLHWTKKIPDQIKNEHRKFWGMSPLKAKSSRKSGRR